MGLFDSVKLKKIGGIFPVSKPEETSDIFKKSFVYADKPKQLEISKIALSKIVPKKELEARPEIETEKRGLDIFKPIQLGLTITRKAGKAISNFLLDNFAPAIRPTYEKIKEGKAPLQSYSESVKELRGEEKQRETDVKSAYEEAEKRGASTSELNEIISQSPMIQRLVSTAIMSGTVLRAFKPGQMTTKMARDILKTGKKATEKIIKDAFNKALHQPKLYPKLAGISKQSGRAELELLKEARDVLLRKITPISKEGIKLIEGMAKKEVIAPIKLRAIKPITKPTIKPAIRPLAITKAVPETIRPPTIKPIPKELEPLVVEARKYKSAQEFIESVRGQEGIADKFHKWDIEQGKFEIKAGKKYPIRGWFDTAKDFYAQATKEIKPTKLTAKEEFKVGDIIDTQGKSNMVGKVTIRKVEGNSLYFTDAEGTNFSGIARSQVRTLIKEGAWKKATKEVKPVKPVKPVPTEPVPRERALAEVRGEEFILKGVPEVKGLKPETKLRKEVSRILKQRDYDKIVGTVKDAKEILNRRRLFIRAVQKQFGLSDADLKSITRRDIRLMSNFEFKQFLDKVRVKSEELALTRQARNELMAQITEKNLDIEPLRKAMKLPSISKMSVNQLKELDEVIQPYNKGDVFLSKRKLETIERTELSGIKTYGEAREILAKKLGVKPEDLNNIKISEFDRFKGEAGLAEKDPFFRMMIEETARLRLIREAEFLDIERQALKLARKLKTTPLQKIIPQQKNIRRWFEATDKSTVELTKAESDLVKYMQGEWIKARDYLVKMEAMNKGIKAENYFTHIRRGILEAVKEDGVIKAAKEAFNQYKLDEQVFDILNRQTGEVLAMDKFFKFALRRTGELKPTENIVRAFTTYMRTFKKKQALDEIVPLIDIYAHALTPKGLTKEGLLLHGNLQKFIKEWLNTQKGRRITLVAKQGGKIDWALRSARGFTTLMDIGLNIPVTVATQVGEQAITYQLLGKAKYIKAKLRALTPRGKRITKKYRNIIGKNPWGELTEPLKDIGDRLSEGIFVMFKDANVRRNRNFLLGSMTKAEWKAETLSIERLGQMRIEMARYGVMDGAKSIIGATPEAGVVTQYKTWALPILGSISRNLKYLAKYIGTFGKSEKFRGKRAALELYRMMEFVGIVLLIKSFFTTDKDDDSMLGKIKRRAYQEATTLFQAIDPNLFLGVPRLWSWVNDLGGVVSSLVQLEKYEQTRFGKYEEGELKGLKKLKLMFTPRFIKQFDKEKQKEIEDINKQILKEIESGELTVEAAKEKYLEEIKKLESAQKKKRFELSLEDYRKDLLQRIENKEISVEDAKIEFGDYVDKKPDEFKSKDEKSFIQKVILYAKAIETDPVTAFIFMFEGERIRKIENGAIIVERIPFEESQEIRTQRGATKEMILDHTIPLQLGGSNKESNLKLVSVEEWESYTIVENYLGDKLRAGLIDKKTAQKLIKQFKEGLISEEEITK